MATNYLIINSKLEKKIRRKDNIMLGSFGVLPNFLAFDFWNKTKYIWKKYLNKFKLNFKILHNFFKKWLWIFILKNIYCHHLTVWSRPSCQHLPLHTSLSILTLTAYITLGHLNLRISFKFYINFIF